MIKLARVLSGIVAALTQPRELKVEMVDTNLQAAAAAEVTRSAPLEFHKRIDSGAVHLLQVRLDGSPWPAPVRGTTYCLDVHENGNAMRAAIEYVRQARAHEPGPVLTFTPSIYALVNTSILTPGELRLVNDELIPAGASIFEYPKVCRSFAEAMRALFAEIAETRRAYAGDRERLSQLTALRKQRQAAAPAISSVRAVGQGASSGSLEASAAE